VLTTIESCSLLPGLNNPVIAPLAWLNKLIGAADRAVKRYCKRDLELQFYVEFLSGSGQDLSRDLVCRQFPVWCALQQVTASSVGQTLPQSTINVTTTLGFHPGTGGNQGPGFTPSFTIQTAPIPGQVNFGNSSYQLITYTGTTPTSFTGCTGGTGIIAGTQQGNSALPPVVFTPSVFFDQGGYFGFSQNGFGPGTLMAIGSQYVPIIDSPDTDLAGQFLSHRGLIRRIGGAGQGFIGFYPENFYSGKLSAFRMPTWPRGDGSIKVQYAAGYQQGRIPPDLEAATNMLVAYMVRNHPSGTPLSSESLGAYTYSVLSQKTDVPEIGSIQKMLSSYRESSWGYP